MEHYQLLPTDAFHVVIARTHGVKAIALTDEDFLRVDGIIIYVP